MALRWRASSVPLLCLLGIELPYNLLQLLAQQRNINIQIFWMNTSFISSREVRKKYFCIFRFTRWNKWHIQGQNLNYLFIIYNFKRDRFLAIKTSYTIAHYVILMMTLHNVSETTGLRESEISANLDNFITKIFFTILFRKWIPTLCVFISTDKKL